MANMKSSVIAFSLLTAAAMALAQVRTIDEASEAPLAQSETPQSTQRPRSLALSVALDDGAILDVVLQPYDYQGEGSVIRFIGRLSVSGSISVDAELVIRTEDVASELSDWQGFRSGSMTFSLNPATGAANIHELEMTANSLAVESNFLQEQVKCFVVVAGHYPDLADALGLGSASDGRVAIAISNFVSDAVIERHEQLDSQDDDGGVTFEVCVKAASAACGSCDNLSCLKSVTWTPGGGCTFTCKTSEECCKS